jgi:hypothetical protein
MPFAVADAVARRGRPVVLFAMKGIAQADRVERYPHHWIVLGQMGRFKRLAQAQGCQDFVWIGSLVRPSVWSLRFDLQTVLQLPKIVAAFRGGDDHLLSGLGRVFEQYGFRLLGAHDVAPDILMPAGTLTQQQPSAQDHEDIAVGADFLATIGRFDIGQAVVVAVNRVLGVEAAEGTDAMLTRIAELRQTGRLKATARTGVMIKAAKSIQDRRFDLPAIGPQTIDGAARAGLAGIAVVAGETVIAEIERTIEAADKAGLFIIGLDQPSS